MCRVVEHIQYLSFGPGGNLVALGQQSPSGSISAWGYSGTAYNKHWNEKKPQEDTGMEFHKESHNAFHYILVLGSPPLSGQ